MKRFVFLIAMVAAGISGYQYYTTGKVNLAAFAFWKNSDKPPPLPKKDEQGNPLVPCPKCAATGQVPCTAPRCKAGKVPCPGKCLKESDFKERWPEPVAGHAPDELWVVFRLSGGRRQGLAKNHIGEVAGVRNGEFYREGPCPVCKGTSVVDCKVCSGSALVPCPLCHGEKVVAAPRGPAPAASRQASKQTPVHAPKTAAIPQAVRSQPGSPIRLKNGKTINGTIVIRGDAVTWIRTDDGKRIEVKSADILSR